MQHGERVAFPVDAVGLVHFELREAQQANQLSCLFEVAFDETGG